MAGLEPITPPITDRLYATYGELLTLEDVSKILNYSSCEAVRKAIARGTLKIPITKIKNRRETFIKTEALVNYLNSI